MDESSLMSRNQQQEKWPIRRSKRLLRIGRCDANNEGVMHETDESDIKVTATTYDDIVSADDAFSLVARNQQQEERLLRCSKQLQVGRNCDADESNSLKVGTINKEDTSVDDKELLPSDKIGRESKWEQSGAARTDARREPNINVFFR